MKAEKVVWIETAAFGMGIIGVLLHTGFSGFDPILLVFPIAITAPYFISAWLAPRTRWAVGIYQTLVLVFLARVISLALWFLIYGDVRQHSIHANYGSGCSVQLKFVGILMLTAVSSARLVGALCLGVNKASKAIFTVVLLGLIFCILHPTLLEPIVVGNNMGVEWVIHGVIEQGCAIE